MFRRTRIVAAAPLVFTAVGALLGFIWLRTSLPQTTGTISVADLGTSVEIVRDKKGIPHIFAKNATDAAFALGFAHAQDGLWQMEYMRRIGAGRLSEIIGPETLATDKFVR
ncbi:MAG: penicillin acylase family protein, partial [Pseudomonadota bacterium]|nr:penicillin acylase family protein [Pseudomonadota bacterium]